MTAAEDPSAALDRLAEDFLSRVRDGEAPDVETYARAHPELADRLRQVLPMLALMEGVKGTDAPERIGPYRIVREIGRGGMGRVYEGRDEATGGLGRVAVKVIRSRLLHDERFVARFLREVRVGQSITHPNVVRTHGAGTIVQDGVEAPYLVLEYVEGQNLRDLLQEVGRVPERLCRHIGHRVGDALTAFAGAGIVHRDIKPENVVITADETVKVMDMGVALLQEEALRLSGTGDFVGSPLYASPEQLSGGAVDSRTDLYALGLLLYELLTGHHAGPGRAASLVATISPFLDAVVRTLLQPEPADRFASAADLCRVLAAGEGSTWWRQRLDERHLTPGRLRLRRVERLTAHHGRQQEREILDRCLEACSRGQGHVVLIEGEAGMGKTRLLGEWIEQKVAADDTLRVVVARHVPRGDVIAESPLAAALLEEIGEDDLPAKLERYLGDDAWLVKPLAAHLRGHLAGVPAASLATALIRLILAMGRESPLVLALEDVHFASEAALAFYAHLARSAAQSEFLLILTTRPPPGTSAPGVLASLDPQVRIELQGLPSTVCRSLLEEAIGDDAAQLTDPGPLIAKSDGNPFFLLELAGEWKRARRAAVADGNTPVPPSGTQVPSTVQEFIQGRLAALEPAERDLLSVAACYGYEFDPVLVAEAAGAKLVASLKAFGHLERVHGLLSATGEHYRFQHHLVQEALCAETHPALRKAYHTAIGDVLLEAVNLGGQPPEEIDGAQALILCTHLLNGDRPQRAAPFYRAASRHLVGLAEYARDLALHEQALAIEGVLEGALRAWTLDRMGAGLIVAGRRADAMVVLEEALRVADTDDDSLTAARARLRLGRQLSLQDEHDRGFRLLEAAVARARQAGDKRVEAQALSELGNSLGRAGRKTEGRERCREALTVIEGEEASYTVPNLLRNLALAELSAGKLADVERLLNRAVDLVRKTGDRGSECLSLRDLAALAARRADFEALCTKGRESMAVARELGLHYMQATIAIGIATGSLELGRFDDVSRWATDAVAIAERNQEEDNLIQAGGVLAQLDLARGDWAGALARLQTHLGDLAHVARNDREIVTVRAVVRLLGLLGRLDRAAELAERNVEEARKWNDPLRVAHLLTEVGHLAEHAGRHEAAAVAFREAVDAAALTGARHGQRSLGLGRALLGLGDQDGAREALTDAHAWGRETGAVRIAVVAAAYLARGSEGDLLAARVALEAQEKSLPRRDRMEAHLALYEAGGGMAHLDAARRELATLQAGAPEEDRQRMIDAVSLHARVVRATAE